MPIYIWIRTKGFHTEPKTWRPIFLKNSEPAPGQSLDLHGYTSDEARALLSVFITEQMKAGHRAVRIIHGQGFGSFQKKPVLKERVPGWLIQKKEVLAFVEAPSFDGGAGALYVLLAPL